MTDAGDAFARAEEAELARRRTADGEYAAPAAGGGPAGRASLDDDRFVSPLADSDERVIESALRPKRLEDFVGQRGDEPVVITGSAARRTAGGRGSVLAVRYPPPGEFRFFGPGEGVAGVRHCFDSFRSAARSAAATSGG